MQIENSGFYLGRIGSKYIVWNEKKTKEFTAKNIQEAVAVAKEIIKNLK